VFVTSFYDGSLLMQLGNSNQPTAEKVWRRKGFDEKHTDALHSIISTPLFLGDYVYGVDSYGELRCLDAKTGDRLWMDETATPPGRANDGASRRQRKSGSVRNSAGSGPRTDCRKFSAAVSFRPWVCCE